jgi:hypothetical protein
MEKDVSDSALEGCSQQIHSTEHELGLSAIYYISWLDLTHGKIPE